MGGEGCDDSICIDKPKIETSEKINITSLTKRTLDEVVHPQRPLFRTEIGRITWKALHRMTVNYPESPKQDEKIKMAAFFEGLARVFPCKHCADDFQNGIYLIIILIVYYKFNIEIKSNPPKVDNRDELIKWLCVQHNTVNKKINKKEIYDCDNIEKIKNEYKF